MSTTINETPLEHQKDILAFFALPFRNPHGEFPLEHGFTQYTHGFEPFCEMAKANHVFAQRNMLEYHLDFLQALMYSPIIIPDLDNIRFKVQVYQRKGKGDAKVGEVRLQDLFSIGFGGHHGIDDKRYSRHEVIDIGQTLLTGWNREMTEEVTIDMPHPAGMPQHEQIKTRPRRSRLVERLAGFMLDNTPATEEQKAKGKIPVGLVHLAIVMLTITEPGAEVLTLEAEHTICEPMYPEDLLNSDLKLEPWSQMLLEWLVTQSLDDLFMGPSRKGEGHDTPLLFPSSIKV